MADRGDPPEAALQPSRTSDRIRAGAAHMTGAIDRLDHVGRPRLPVVIDDGIAPERPPLARLGPDPAGEMSRLKPDTTRPVQRPHTIDEQLRVITPQFFLRNTARLERYGDPDWIETIRRPVRDVRFWDDLDQAGGCRFERADFEVDTSSVRLAMLLAERRVVMIETRWHEVFGRPDVVE